MALVKLPVSEVNQIKRMVNNEYSGRLLYVTISGSHLYGFESNDGDIDFRGCYLLDTNKIIGLEKPPFHIKRTEGKNDVVLFELKKELELLNDGNCNVMEHLFAQQLYTSDEYFELKRLVTYNMNMSGIYNSYRGLAWSNYNDFCLKGVHTVKKFLYVFRGILAGMYAIQYRSVQPNLEKLLKGKESHYYYKPIMELIRLKKSGNENDFLPDSKLPLYHKLVIDLLGVLDKMWEDSKPTEKIQKEIDRTRFDVFNKYLKKVRKNFIRKNEKSASL